MAKNQINAELYNLLKSLLAFVTVIYKLYRPYITITLLGLVAYIGFRLGRSSIIDSLQQSIGKLSQILQRRADFTIFLPQKITKIAKIRKTILFVLLLSAGLWLFVYSFKIKAFKKVKVKHILIYAITMSVSLVFVWIYQLVLHLQVKKGRSQDLTINEKLYALQKDLGPRTEGLLKIFLCKEQIIKRPSSPRGVCIKDNCKRYRQLLRQKTNEIEYLVNSALNFSWCFVCKKRMQFNEFLQFQTQPYIQVNLPEQEQIIKKNSYLLEELFRMTHWVRDISPCNCSQIYWRQSLKYIKQYKKRQKQIDKGLVLYESKQMLRH